MKITILGIDGLEHDIVEELDLRFLKQEFYTKISIPDECYIQISSSGERTPWTPLCWMTIITGKLPPEDVIPKREEIFENKMLEFIRWKVGPYLGRIKEKRKYFKKIGFKTKNKKREFKVDGPISRKTKSIFDLVDRSINFNVPTYSQRFKLKPIEGLSARERLKLIEKETELMKDYTLSVLNRKSDYELCMVYNRVLDSYGHQLYRTERFYNQYRMMDLFLKEVSERVEGALLIISDHGFQRLEKTKSRGKHSDDAFFSSNVPIAKKIESLLDFYDVVQILSMQ